MHIDCFDDKSDDFQRYWHNFSSVIYTSNILNGKWKVSILMLLQGGPMRLSELRRALIHVSNSALIRQLQELEQDNIVDRTVYPEVPPHVDYRLTDTGTDLMDVIVSMRDFGEAHNAVLQKEMINKNS